MFVRNAWYVAAWDHEIEEGTLVRRLILGTPLVIFRGESGRIIALDDRCCHRGAPLSMGRIEGDCLRCMYHGAKFDAQGVCLEIPGQEIVAATARVRSYPVVARNRWIWIWPGDPTAADPAAIPDAFSLDHPDWAMMPGYMHYKACQALIVDNLLDFSHLAYVHRTTLGGTENIAENRPQVKRIDRGVEITRWLIDDVPAPFHEKVGQFSGKVDRWHIYKFLIPGILLMYSGVQATGTGAPQGHIENALEFRSCQAVTPETDGTSHYFFAVPHNFAIDQPSITQSIFDSVVAAFEEDKVMIEAQQRNLDLAPGFPMTTIAHDAGLVQYRRLVERLRTEEMAAAAE